MMHCPKCTAPLDVIHLPEGVDIESCQNCFGAFYEAKELALALVLDGEKLSEFVCPKCDGPMKTGSYRGQLTLDRCAACSGFWFDGGEIRKLREVAGIEGIVGSSGVLPPAPKITTPPPVPPVMPAAAWNAFVAPKEGSPLRKGKYAPTMEPVDCATK